MFRQLQAVARRFIGFAKLVFEGGNEGGVGLDQDDVEVAAGVRRGCGGGAVQGAGEGAANSMKRPLWISKVKVSSVWMRSMVDSVSGVGSLYL